MAATRNPQKTAGIGDEAVEKATGRTWAAWIRALDRAGAGKMTHKEIAVHLHRNESLSGWWSQMVTVGYEQARGRRLPGQKPTGFDISKSKTLPVSAAKAFAAWKDAARRRAWLRAGPAATRSATPNKTMRLSWSDDASIVNVNFYPKSRTKCQVVVQQTRLPNAKAAEKMKAFWAGALVRLETHLD